MVSAVQSTLAERAVLVEQEMRLSTPGVRYQVRWDDTGSVTALGQWAFFAEFLDVSGLFERWVANCPMRYTSPNVRLALPPQREATTSRPLLLAGGARLATHAGQSRLQVTLTHAGADLITAMIANVCNGLDTILATAPQLPKPDRWKVLARYIISKIVAVSEKFASTGPAKPPPGLASHIG